MGSERNRGVLALMLAAALAGCQIATPVGTKATSKPRPAANKGKSAQAATITPKVDYAPLGEQRRPLGAAADLTSKIKLVPVELTGKAKLISDHGGGIVSNNSGGLISNNGGGVIANNGSNLIANNGGGLTGKTKYALLAGVEESLLAEAAIEVLDGAGNVLVGADGKPIGTVTDKQGGYRFVGELPDENLLLRVRLYNGGHLMAMLPRAAGGGPRAIDLDTAASLGAAYVMETFVQKRAAVFAKLPAAEAEALTREIAAAREHLPASARSYRVTDLVAGAAAISEKARPVADRLERIKAILLAGQANLGTGRLATEVSLSAPAGVLGLPDGSLLIAEAAAGRIRRVTPDGKVGLFLGAGKFFDGKAMVESKGEFLETPGALARLADGALLVTDHLAHRVRKITPDGTVRTVLGTGARAQSPAKGQPGTEVAVSGPRCLAVAGDGSVYVGEITKQAEGGRILHLRADGTVVEIAPPSGPDWERAEVAALALGPDGTLYAAEARKGLLHKRTPEGVWSVMDANAGVGDFSTLLVTADGDLLLTANGGDRVVRYGRDGKRETIAGTGVPGHSGDGGPSTQAMVNRPTGIWVAPDGRIIFGDGGNSLVREIARDGTIRTIAGTTSITQAGDATTIAINSPSGVAIDPDGKLVISEAAGDTIKRLDGGTLTVIAGSGKGLAGDGGPATQARFNVVGAIAYAGRDLWLTDSSNARIRKISAAGIVTSEAGAIDANPRQSQRMPARSAAMGLPLGLAIGPDGLPYWADNEENQVRRLTRDGFVEVVAGSPTGDEGNAPDEPAPALGGLLNSPIGLAFDPKGDLYVCDTGNLKVRRITGLTSGTPTMSTYAGNTEATFALLAGQPVDDEGKPATQGLVIGPLAIAFDPEGRCYVSEAGTSRLTTLGGAVGLVTDNLPRIMARIRRIDPDGTMRTIAGPGTGLLADPSSDDSLITPLGLVIDPQGRLIIADSGNNQIKLLPKGSF